MAELEALEAEEKARQPGHTADTAPLRMLKLGANPPQNGALVTDSRSVEANKLQPSSVPIGAASAGNGSTPKGYVVLFARPFQNFQIGVHRYEADSAGEILVDETEVMDREHLLAAGCRNRR